MVYCEKASPLRFGKNGTQFTIWHQRSRQDYSKSSNIRPLRSMAIHQFQPDLGLCGNNN
ncbi:unnamed protein product [Absidia cylindrospora]